MNGLYVGIASAIFLCVSVSGCNSSASDKQAAEIIGLKTELHSLKSQVERVESANARLIVDTYNLRLRTEGSATLDPASADGYSMMGTSVGPLLLSLENVRPLADGSQVTVNVGNPHAVSLLGIALNVKYGARLKEGADYAQWENSLAEKDVSIVDTIHSGSWTKVRFSLPGVKPDELGHLAINGDINRLSLVSR